MKKVLIELHYLPSIEYFTACLDANEIVVEAHETFTKQTFRNRCQILGPNKVQNLIIPVKHANSLITEVEIAYEQKWPLEHWRTLEASYNKSPYMLYYKDKLNQIYQSKPKTLFEFNLKLLTFCLQQLSINAVVSFTNSFEKIVDNEIIDLRGEISPKVQFSERNLINPKPYFQQFGKAFVPNLSIIDLLMSAGPEARQILADSKPQVQND